MAIEMNPDGWSKKLLRYTRSSNNYKYEVNPCIDSSYSEQKYRSSTYYNWYTKSYWSKWTLARKFKNNTTSSLILRNMTFNAAPAHSNGKKAQVDNGQQYYFVGHGCKFYCDVFYENKPNYDSTNGVYVPNYTSKAGTLARIYSTNCHTVVKGVTYLGETDVSLVDAGVEGVTMASTKFGQHSSYQNSTDSNGTKLGMQKIVLEFDDDIIVEPGQAVFLVISCPQAGWTSTDWNDGGVAVEATAGSWDAVVEPSQADYIWVMTDSGWQKARMAYKMTNNGWEVMEEV